jgi:hypothetical protein
LNQPKFLQQSLDDYLVEVLAHPDQDDRDRLFLGTLVVRESA